MSVVGHWQIQNADEWSFEESGDANKQMYVLNAAGGGTARGYVFLPNGMARVEAATQVGIGEGAFEYFVWYDARKWNTFEISVFGGAGTVRTRMWNPSASAYDSELRPLGVLLMLMKRIPRSDDGFTLIEVLVALLILAIVALGVAGMFSHAMVVNASGYDYARLASQARFVLEELRARPFDDPTLVATTGTIWVPQSATYSNSDFTATYAITDFSINNWTDLGAWTPPTAGNPGNVKRITVRLRSTAQNLQGRRELVVSALKVRGDDETP